MAVLGDIRKKSWLLILGIGLPLLAFLIGDAFGSGGGGLFSNPNELGVADGAPISAQDYNMAYNRISSAQQNQPAERQMSANAIGQTAWNQLVQERLVNQQMEEIGVDVSDQEYFERAAQFYSTVEPALYQNGVADIPATKQFMARIKAAAQKGDRTSQYFYEQWQNNNPKSSLLAQKYRDLISAGALSTDLEAKYRHEDTGSAEVNYVFVSYVDLAKNDSVSISDQEIKDYVKKNKKAYKPEPTVNLAYAYFPAEASEQDIATIRKELDALKAPQVIVDEATGTRDSIPSFANAKDNAAFVARFSDVPFDSTYYSRDQFDGIQDPALKNALSNAKLGDVMGPLKVQNSYELIKLSGEKMITDSAKTSHILIGYEGSQARGEGITRSPEEAKKLADSLYTNIQANPALFNEYARTVSDDKVAAKDDGSIGWVGRFQQGFATSYRDFAVNNPKGTIEVVPSEFGFHIIRIDDVKQKEGYQFAAIIKQLNPSKETQDNLFNTANQVALDAQGKSVNDFINDARQKGAEVNSNDGLGRFATNITGLTGTQKEADILKWSFNKETKPGMLERFETTQGGQIVVYLEDKFKKKEINVAAAREIVEPILKNKKLAETAMAKIGDSKGSLDNVASTLGSSVQKATVNFARPSLQGAGVEPKLGGVAQALKEGQMSQGIEGNNGVFYVQVTKRNAPAAKEDLSAERKQVRSMNKTAINNQIIPSLVESADIEDYRAEKLR